MTSFTVFKGSKEGVAVKSTATKPQLTGDKVLMKITASGLCGTDLHYMDHDIVLGHEGVGVVEEVGPEAKYLKKGDRVGFGYEHDSCGHCQECLTGNETYCAERAIYGTEKVDQGSFASYAVVRESFLHQIPEGMSDIDAAPLQCAGATVFAALRAHDTQPTETIGVIGLGGLGHMAIQFAAKMGNRVVVLSGTERKREEAMKLGAHEFVAIKGKDKIEVEFPINRLLVTTSAQPNWELLMPIMAPRSAVYLMSVASGNMEVPYMPLVYQGIAVKGSLVASRILHREMLAFAALHNIKPITEVFPMTEEGIKNAIERLESGAIHLRAVLTAV
ncbi:GroES-like protein [Annulohypoxylon maeteangense]|uniref:GroES-like protein n=1 Tax=Annulohypoxylon maeteangense TaxID=1927788 RepID=UPI002008C05B|nr:GroES-like protein [Annulohypoxylon maeteangense]KAI0887590.1 GroES-like protein [Annulohypoxylon maeteangense]